MPTGSWEKLHPKTRIALIIKPMIGILIFVMIFVLPWMLMSLDLGWPLIYFVMVFLAIVGSFFLVIITWAVMFYNRYLFLIGDDAVFINRGILWKRNVTIPYSRIQHTSTTQGPIDILLGLHMLNIFTAGSTGMGGRFGGASEAFAADGSIPGLSDPGPYQEAIMSKVRALKGNGLGTIYSPGYEKPLPHVTPAAAEKAADSPGARDDVQTEMLTELKRIRGLIEKQNRK